MCSLNLVPLRSAERWISERRALVEWSLDRLGQYWPRPLRPPTHRRTPEIFFGDAAAAAVLTRSAPYEKSAIWRSQFVTYSSGANLTEIVRGGTLHHPNDPMKTEMNTFHMDGPTIFKFAAQQVRLFLDRFFEQLEWERSDVDVLVPHQASRHAVLQLTGRFGFRREQVFLNLAERGKCVAASILLAFAEAITCGTIQRGGRILLVGTGAGLTIGACALTY